MNGGDKKWEERSKGKRDVCRPGKKFSSRKLRRSFVQSVCWRVCTSYESLWIATLTAKTRPFDHARGLSHKAKVVRRQSIFSREMKAMKMRNSRGIKNAEKFSLKNEIFIMKFTHLREQGSSLRELAQELTENFPRVYSEFKSFLANEKISFCSPSKR